MSITESLKKLAEEAAEKVLSQGVDVVSIPTAGDLMLVRAESAEGTARKNQPGAIAEILLFKEKEFYICNW